MQQKPPLWNVSPALVAQDAQHLWKGVAFLAPLCGVEGGRGALLAASGQPLAGANLIAGSTAQRRSTPYGLGVGISGASNLLSQDNFAPFVTSNGAFTGDCTIVCLANPIAEARTSVLVSQAVTGAAPSILLVANASNTSGGFRFDAGAGGVAVANIVNGNYRLFGGVRQGAVNTSYIDGVSVATQAAAAQAVGSAAAGIAIGNMAESTTNRIATSTNIVFVAAWNRALSAAEMRMLARDPFCMFRRGAEWRGVWTPLSANAILSPADLTDGFGFETPGISQAHVFSAADAFFAEGFETPGVTQGHLFSPQEINFATPFDAAFVTLESPGAPGFRSRAISGNTRSSAIGASTRSAVKTRDERSKLITE